MASRPFSSPGWEPVSPVEEIGTGDLSRFPEIADSHCPVVIRGLVADWPLVAAGGRSPAEAAQLLARYDGGAPARIMRAPPQEDGRFFYKPTMDGFNFTVEQAPLSDLIDELLRRQDDAEAPALYAGSALLDEKLPGFNDAHRLPIPTFDASPRIWVGNRTQIATHYDGSDNIAVVAAGRRRFTLFPPEQTPNLYPGPLDVTIAGQPVSMVDLRAPDLTRYPRFAEAMGAALVADLLPGDAIFVPALWWHNVESTGSFNILVNYWHNNPADGFPVAAFMHALLSVRDLPAGQRRAWQTWFDHYVFGEGAETGAAHLPPHVRGVLGPANDLRSRALRAYLARAVSGPPGG